MIDTERKRAGTLQHGHTDDGTHARLFRMSADIEGMNGHRVKRPAGKHGTSERVAVRLCKTYIAPIFFSIPRAACQHICDIVHNAFVFDFFENVYVRVEFFNRTAQTAEPGGIFVPSPLRFRRFEFGVFASVRVRIEKGLYVPVYDADRPDAIFPLSFLRTFGGHRAARAEQKER